MRTGGILSSELYEPGHRLNGGYFLSEDEEAVRVLRRWRGPRVLLHDVCLPGGVFSGGIFRIVNANDARHGRPYVSARDLVQTEITPASFLSNNMGSRLDDLSLRERMILITCSGMNLGKVIWTRSDMDGLCASGDLIRVLSDETKIPAGYLYTFLASRYGWAHIRQLIFGGHIRHIEPNAVSRISIPRLGSAIEAEAGELVEEAATLRVAASKSLRRIASIFDRVIEGIDLESASPRINSVSSVFLRSRMDAQFHDPLITQIRRCVEHGPHSSIRDWCPTIFLPGIFKRIHTSDPNFGVPYFTGASLYWNDPIPKAILSRGTAESENVVLEENTVLIQAFGQEGGLTGKPLWVGEHLSGCATTHMLVRLRAATIEDTAYLYGFLLSNCAYKQIAGLPYGGSIPHFDEAGIATVVMPLFEKNVRSAIAEDVMLAVAMRDKALSNDKCARAIVERAIEEAI